MGEIRWIGGRTRIMTALVALTIVLVGTLARADAPNRAGLVVVHGDGSVETRCVEFSESQISGFELLERSGLDLNYEAGGGMGGAICRIDGEGCTYPQEDCFCQCQSGGEDCLYWSYWHLVDGSWQYSSLGAANYNLSNGDVDGWVWGTGSVGEAGQSPPDIPFENVCQADPPTPTSTFTPTLTSTPTNTPTPAATPTPEPTPIIEYLTADRTTINAGENVTLRWNLSGAKAAYLHYDGAEEGVVAPGSKTVTPVQTTMYTLVAINNDGGKATAQLTITVNPVTPTPPSAGSSAVQPVVSPTGTPSPTAAVEPVIDFFAASLTLPQGACTTLHWTVDHADTVLLNDAPVEPAGSREACPAQTQTYILRARYPGGERTAQLTLQVMEPIVMATGTPIPTAATTAPVPQPSPTPTPATAAQVVSPSPRSAIEVSPRPEPVLSADTGTAPRALLARIGLWGVLAGGWCLIVLAAVAVWGSLWWLNRGRR